MAFSATIISKGPQHDSDGEFERWSFTNGGGDTGGAITAKFLTYVNYVAGAGITSVSISGKVVTITCVDGGDGYIELHKVV